MLEVVCVLKHFSTHSEPQSLNISLHVSFFKSTPPHQKKQKRRKQYNSTTTNWINKSKQMAASKEIGASSTGPWWVFCEASGPVCLCCSRRPGAAAGLVWFRFGFGGGVGAGGELQGTPRGCFRVPYFKTHTTSGGLMLIGKCPHFSGNPCSQGLINPWFSSMGMPEGGRRPKKCAVCGWLPFKPT